MNNAAENRRKKALLIVNPCAGKNRTRSDLGEIVNAFPDGVFDFTIKYTTCQDNSFASGFSLIAFSACDGVIEQFIPNSLSTFGTIYFGVNPQSSSAL